MLAVALNFVPGFSVQTVHAQAEQTLYSFTGFADGGNPLSSLVVDSAGNLYGTTFVGGAHGAGEVFELTPNAGGGWTETVLYSFTGGADGANPYLADVVFDKAGNLYGTTVGGGAHNLGAVFELSPTSSGWSETVLYSFSGGSDGANPYAGLLFDGAGNLYGTTNGGGANNVGTVFELRHGSGASWTEKVLHTLNTTDGSGPIGGLVFDRAGNLYGTTQGGGTAGAGVVYEVVRGASGTWTQKVLHSFTGGADGGFPYAERLIFDRGGNLYGTTSGGGTLSLGAVFRLRPVSGGWKEKVLYSFDGQVAANPYSGLVLDSQGNLYGTAANGNGVTTVGAVFQLTRQSGDTWTETNLHLFTRGDGEFPESALLRDQAGNLYGTTLQGGTGNMGVVFELSQ